MPVQISNKRFLASENSKKDLIYLEAAEKIIEAFFTGEETGEDTVMTGIAASSIISIIDKEDKLLEEYSKII